MFERFTQSARGVVMRAREEADRRGGDWVGTEHVVVALADDDGLAGPLLRDAGLSAQALRAALAREAPGDDLDAEALRSIGIDLQDVRRAVERTFGEGALDEPAGLPARRRGRHIAFTSGAKKSLELAVRETLSLGGRSIGSEHLLLGVLHEAGAGVRLLTRVGADVHDLRAATASMVRRSA